MANNIIEISTDRTSSLIVVKFKDGNASFLQTTDKEEGDYFINSFEEEGIYSIIEYSVYCTTVIRGTSYYK